MRGGWRETSTRRQLLDSKSASSSICVTVMGLKQLRHTQPATRQCVCVCTGCCGRTRGQCGTWSYRSCLCVGLRLLALFDGGRRAVVQQQCDETPLHRAEHLPCLGHCTLCLCLCPSGCRRRPSRANTQCKMRGCRRCRRSPSSVALSLRFDLRWAAHARSNAACPCPHTHCPH